MRKLIHGIVALLCLGGPSAGLATTYYVNDTSTNGDVYCTAVGNDTNTGLSVSAPMRTISTLIANYTLGPGDTVLIDTGTYSNQTVSLTASDGGDTASALTFRGSTNFVAGGSVIDSGQFAVPTWLMTTVTNVAVQNLTLLKGLYCLSLSGTRDCVIERVTAAGMSAGAIASANGGTNIFDRCLAYGPGTGFVANRGGPYWVTRSVFWSNTVAFSQVEKPCSLSNSVIAECGSAFAANSETLGDYNVIWGTKLSDGVTTLLELQALLSSWSNSVNADPRFADPANLDFHPRSQYGRINGATGNLVTDQVTSILIDLGNPVLAWTNEPGANGGRMDAGLFGNHPEASRSSTGAWLRVLAHQDGGLLTGASNVLRWNAGNFTNGARVRLEYGGWPSTNWMVIVTNQPATNGLYVWDVTSLPATAAYWRVISADATGVLDRSHQRFSINGAVVPYYVNDASVSGDVYCLTAGSATNGGELSTQPAEQLGAVLARYSLSGVDQVFVDTGYYSNLVAFVTGDDGGSVGTGSARLTGSTNELAGGTRLDRGTVASGDTLLLNDVSYLCVDRMRILRGQQGVRLASGCRNVELTRVTVSGSGTTGFLGQSGSNNVFRYCTALSVPRGVTVTGTNWLWDQGVCISNTIHSFSGAGMEVRNSIVSGGILFASPPPGRGDYNVFRPGSLGAGLAILNDLQKAQNGWWNSIVAPPLFVDEGAGDLHVSSPAGRYDPATSSFVTTDTQYSVAIDFGDPLVVVSNETAPNGGRVNAGRYGNTGEASRSRTNAWLLALTYNDGGTLSAPGDLIYWTYDNLPTGATVRIEFSGDAGADWQVAVTNLSAAAGSYAWANTNFTSSRFARWRVVLESDPAVFDSVDTNFTFRNGPFTYYVNDDSLVGDVYAGAVGNNANLGTTPLAPMATLDNVVAVYQLDAGDVVYVDTGTYRSDTTLTLTSVDSGTNGNPMRILGSTNICAGGTVLTRLSAPGGGTDGITFSSGSRFIDVRDLQVVGRRDGIVLAAGVSNVTLSGVTADSNTVNGITLTGGQGVRIDHTVLRNNRGNGLRVQGTVRADLKNCVFWRNFSNAILATAGQVTLSNSVVMAAGEGAAGFSQLVASNVVGDYNCVFTESNAVVGILQTGTLQADHLSAWISLTTQHLRGVELDPLFANAPGGDYHLQTETALGRLDPCSGPSTDFRTSPLIDAGSPAEAWTNEPGFNGGRINIGRYGNLAEASQGRSTPWLQAGSLGQGGWVRGTTLLHWVAGNLPTGDQVRVEFSGDGGGSWQALVTNALANAEAFLWDTTTVSNTPAGLWRVVHASDSNLLSQTTNFFGVRNGPITFYVNDASTSGDVFAAASGAATNWVASAAKPISSLARVFALYDVEPGDRICVDTGSYTDNENIVVGRLTSGSSTNAPVVVMGSTNECGGGSVIQRTTSGGSVALRVQTAHYVTFSNLTFRQAATGVVVSASHNIDFYMVGSAAHLGDGFRWVNCAQITAHDLRSWGNSGYGFALVQTPGAVLRQSVAWSNFQGAVSQNGGDLSVSNSVLHCATPSGTIYSQVSNAVLRANFNDVFVQNGGDVGRIDGVGSRTLVAWQQRVTNDLLSLTHDPRFAAPGQGRFYPRSEAGRFDPTTCGLVADGVGTNSPLIDTGDPLSSFSQEPAPNGARLNIGPYGNHARASLSRTNGWLLAVSINDGGSVRGSNVLYWVAGGAATGQLVRLEFSANGGVTWTNIVTNYPASNGTFDWDTVQFPSTLAGRWRITSESDTNISDRSDVLFAVNNGPLDFYVNDASLAGDVYCIAAGSSDNDGLTPATPLSSIAEVLSRYTVDDGNRILVDSGSYNLFSPLTLGASIAAPATNRISIQGSTNLAAGGTIIDAGGGIVAFELEDTAGIALRHLTIRNALSGVRVSSSSNCVLENITVYGAPGLESGVYGIELLRAGNIDLVGCAVVGVTNSKLSSAVEVSSSTGIRWSNGILWSNRFGFNVGNQLGPPASSLSVSNSSFTAIGTGSYVMLKAVGTTYTGDYNNFDLRAGAWAVREAVVLDSSLSAFRHLDTLSRWAQYSGLDRRSLSHDPRFAGPMSNDFHLASQGGRFQPGVGVVVDGFTSQLLDAGPPAFVFTNEIAPHGSRVEIGRYANTSEASGTPTNGALLAVSLNDGGRAAAPTQALYWVARGDATGHVLAVDLSLDDGGSWTNLATNLAAGVTNYIWTTTNYPSSLAARWRVRSQTDAGVGDASDAAFLLHNQAVSFYVNDASTNGDHYSSAIGNDAQSGLLPSLPKSSVSAVLAAYDLEAGDIVYVDTGIYSQAVETVIGQLDSGEGGLPVTVQGSTNRLKGGSLLLSGLDAQESRGLALRNLMIQSTGSGGRGVRVQQSTNTVLEEVWAQGGGLGIELVDSVLNVMRRCAVVGAATNGLVVTRATRNSWESGVLWSNRISAISGAGTIAVSNSILAAFASNSVLFNFSGTIDSDYNDVLATNGALVGVESIAGQSFPRRYENLGRWRHDTGRDLHSQSFSPRLAGPEAFDFHLRSEAGRYDPTGGVFVLDASTSPLIDAGNPAADFSAETAPNGGRRNLGLFGGTGEASRTPTNAVLWAASLSDGGVVAGTNVYLYWIAQGLATGHAVRVEYSADAGLTWMVVASNLTDHAAGLVWNTTNFPSSVLALWRVVSQVNTGVMDVSDRLFAVRNGPVSFYVNDAVTTGDVYSLAGGSVTNHGISPLRPMPDVQRVISTYDLEPGDTIYVDTGVYTNATPIDISALDAGAYTSNLLVTLQGSTNVAAGGTVIQAASQPGIRFTQAGGIALRNLRVANASVGVTLSESDGCRFENVVLDRCDVGVQLAKATDTQFRRCVIRESTVAGVQASQATGARFENGILWSNALFAVDLDSGTFAVSNSVVGAFGGGTYAYRLGAGQSLGGADYNCYYLRDGAAMATRLLQPNVGAPFPLVWQNVARWSRDSGYDRRSLSHDPLFADAAAGDFHLLSAGGRFVVTSGVFVLDAATSPLIDAGAPESVYTNESAPNGGRLDIGRFGDSAQASRTPTNARLLVVALNDGGRAEGLDWPLSWVPFGAATSHTVRLDFSADDGATWLPLATNVPARAGLFFWDTLGYPSTARGRWRVLSEVDTNIVDMSDQRFALRNDTLQFYVNDSSITGDVYASAAGAATNSGTAATQPRDSIQSVLDDYDLEPGDTVFIDTGNFLLADAVHVDRFDAWDAADNLAPLQAGGTSITIQGSTNEVAGGTQLRFFQYPVGLTLTQALGVALRNLHLQHEPSGQGIVLRVSESSYSRADWVTAARGEIGFDLDRSHGFAMSHCVARDNVGTGVSWYESAGASFRSGIIWSNSVGTLLNAGQVNSTHRFAVVNSVIGAFGTGKVAQLIARGVLQSDYNGIFATNGALVGGALIGGSLGGGTNKFDRLFKWSQSTGNDLHSYAGDPRFADPVGGDFHLLSPAGRYVTGGGFATNPLERLSPLMDAAEPTLAFDDEPEPNGGRANIGLYGGTDQASKSPTNGVLTALTFNDGSASDGPITLYWAASASLDGCLVSVDFSASGGNTWSNIATNVSATQGSVLWNSEPFGRAAAGLWRVVAQCDTNINDVTTRYFALRNGGSIPYYVNDGITNGDIYAWVAGSVTNDGFLPQTPKASLQDLLDEVDLEPGDIVYVDRGNYPLSIETVVDIFDSGQPTNPVVIQGASNGVGFTTFDRQTGSGNAIRLFQTQGISLRDLTVRNASQGVVLEQSSDCSLVRVDSRANQSSGFVVDRSDRTLIDHSISYDNPSNGVVVVAGLFASSVIADGNTIWGSQCGFRFGNGAYGRLVNNSISVEGGDARVLLFELSAGSVTSDYNHFYRSSGALLAERVNAIGGNDVYGRLIDWQRGVSQDVHTVTADPLFADPFNGDFHPRSATGRFQDNGTPAQDPGVFSPLIDAGQPASSFTNETAPNGARLNLGNWGNHPLASLSPTNPWLRCLTLNDGGLAFGTIALNWVAGGMSTGATVNVQFAPDGVEFTVLASNILASAGEYVWDLSALPPTALARWKVQSETYPGVEDQVDVNFTIKNQALTIYVNDIDTNGDVYCSAPGSVTNSGLSASSPLDDPSTALARYWLTAGDVVYIDTGMYFPTSEVGLAVGRVGDEVEFGITNLPVLIRGSTNRDAGGSSIYASGTNGFGMLVVDTEFVDVEDLRLFGAQTGFRIQDSQYLNLRRVEVFNGGGDGFVLSAGRECRMDRCASYNNLGWGLRTDGGLTRADWEHGVIWSNSAGGIELRGGTLSVSNSALGAAVTNTVVYSVLQGALRSDYNLLWPQNGAQLAFDALRGVRYRNMLSWQKASLLDGHSIRVDPLFYDAAVGDFHLLSVVGRYDPLMAGFVTDSENSWLLDAGDPARAYSAEPFPNGNRINIGPQGGTAQASKSPYLVFDRALRVVTGDDGGSISGPTTLYWLSRALTTSDLVYVEVSTDGGFNWTVVATNVNPNIAGLPFDPTGLPSSPRAYWRVSLQSDPSIQSTNTTRITIRQGPIHYYVNDGDLSGDVYCSGPGSVTNSALGPSVPMDSLHQLLDEYELEGGTNTYGGDVVYVDTGVYAITNTLVIRDDDKGNAFGNVLFQGSINESAGGSLLQFQTTNVLMDGTQDVAVVLYRTRNITLSDFTIAGAGVGVRLESLTSLCSLSNLLIRDGGTAGIQLESTTANRISDSVITRMLGVGVSARSDSGSLVDGCVIWSNGGAAVVGQNLSGFTVSNSVLQVHGANVCYDLFDEGTQLRADHNDLYPVGLEADFAKYGETRVEGLIQWTLHSTQDVHSLSVDPLFANPAADDFHPRSRYGRYDPGLMSFVTTDTNLSYLVDAGSPTSPYTNEPAPNGGLRNIGNYGNHPQASKSRTNAWVMALTGSSGGRAFGTFYLAWSAGNVDATNRVALDYSYDGGTNWLSIASNQPVLARSYLWNSATLAPFSVSPISVWRIRVQADTSVWDRTDGTFALNGPFTFYVNDASTNGDVFTYGPGAPSNLGIYSNAPMSSLRDLFNFWDIEGEDRVLVDVGTYLISTNDEAVMGLADSGNVSSPVTLQGSFSNGGSRLVRSGAGASPLLTVSGGYVSLSNLIFNGGGLYLSGTNLFVSRIVLSTGSLDVVGSLASVANSDLEAAQISAAGDNIDLDTLRIRDGRITINGSSITLENTYAYGGARSPLLTVEGTNIVVLHNTLINTGTVVRQTGADSHADVRNNILVADGVALEAFCILRSGGVLTSDYNLFQARRGAWIGSAGGNWERLLYWQRVSGGDSNSVVADPLLAAEGVGDLHPKSVGGRYTGGVYVVDGVHSPAIDLGDPTSAFGAEPAPNGSRANLGAFGNSAEASLSRSGSWVYAMALNDGPAVKGTNVVLRWTGGGLAASNRVTLQFSANNGISWTNIITDLPALSGRFDWDSTTVTSSLTALWRVVVEGDTGTLDVVDQPFSVRNQSFNFYVNDSNTVGDVFTVAAGSPAFDGTTPASPKPGLMELMTNYDLEGGDTVYVDTGLYPLSQNVRIIWSDGGDASAPVRLWGSTNYAAGGTILDRGNEAIVDQNGVDVLGSFISMKDFTIRRAYRGLYMNSNQYVSAERLNLYSNSYGVAISKSSSTTVRQARVWRNVIGGIDISGSRTVLVEHVTAVDNGQFHYRTASNNFSVLQNNIFYHGLVATARVSFVTGTVVDVDNTFMDYNIYYFTPGSSNGVIYGNFTNVTQWQRVKQRDYRSAQTNPLLVDVESGDFHLQSTAGRYVDGSGFLLDSFDSWGIDRASPLSDFSLEPAPNGDRANIGAYGGTEYASKGNTNTYFDIRVLNDTISPLGTNDTPYSLLWHAHRVPTGYTVRVEYSGDGGVTWQALGTGLSAYQEYVVWNLSPLYNTFTNGLVRVVADQQASLTDTNNGHVALFFGEHLRFRPLTADENTPVTIKWRGSWGEHYQVQYATGRIPGQQTLNWSNAPLGGATNQVPNFISVYGGDQVYEDPESSNRAQRLYRVIWEQHE